MMYDHERKYNLFFTSFLNLSTISFCSLVDFYSIGLAGNEVLTKALELAKKMKDKHPFNDRYTKAKLYKLSQVSDKYV